jgi:hypothetical protein
VFALKLELCRFAKRFHRANVVTATICLDNYGFAFVKVKAGQISEKFASMRRKFNFKNGIIKKSISNSRFIAKRFG